MSQSERLDVIQGQDVVVARLTLPDPPVAAADAVSGVMEYAQSPCGKKARKLVTSICCVLEPVASVKPKKILLKLL